ncbi:WD repeat and HMG-box DNA-binding protein 1-like [Octopus sinensis]|uniref:WD repeat and HMG-box DNA-binding protein 1-like n=1 Tax=Octopus sinensis TaxID=2607531 RepID=A0A7E6EH98_9MOLL|nr:WD repeat and HMG-box DNA-binding protein 1-like [Octopus sinensis]
MDPLAKPSIRYGHSPGHTDVCYDDSGRYILSCGTDGDVRIWDGFNDSDAMSYQIGEKVFAVLYKNHKFYTASDVNSIQIYTFPDGIADGMVTRFTAPANHMCFNRAGTILVAGASDFMIKITDVRSSKQKSLQGHEAPILSVALHPKGLFLASSSCDGSYRVWSMSTHTSLKTWNGLARCSDVSLAKSLCRLCWDPLGENLLVPVEKEIIVYDTKTWNKTAALTDAKIKDTISILMFSSCQKYLAASCFDGLLLIFDWSKRLCIQSYKHEKTFTAICWNPIKSSEIIFTDNEGQIGLFENVLSTAASKNTSAEQPAVTTSDPASATVDNNLDDDDDAFDDLDDEMLSGAIGPDIPSVDAGEQSDNEFSAKLNPEAIFDDDASKDGASNMSDGESTTTEQPLKPTAAVPYNEPKILLQKPFQPGSTPDHLSQRFMKWNAVGIVKQYNADGENSIDIEFHDTAVHHSIHLNNNVGYTMADISKECVLLGSPNDEESGRSKMTCLHFAAWDNSKEWSVTLPEEEEILAVTAAETWVAMATSERLLRLFTMTGIQKEILTLAGPIVCLSGFKDFLMVVYHRGGGLPGEQCLGIDLYQLTSKKKCILKDLLPLSPKAFLCWAGFSAEGTPFYMDSSGMLNMLNRKFGNSWTPACDTKSFAKGKSDHFWIISILESQQQIRCIPCKGSRFPPTLPRPTLRMLPLQIPMCELSTEKSQYEEKFRRLSFVQSAIDQCVQQGEEVDTRYQEEAVRGMKEELMKSFALSVRSERECRALDICEMMPDEHTLQLAVKYAARLMRMQLAGRINEMAHKRRMAEEMRLLKRKFKASYGYGVLLLLLLKKKKMVVVVAVIIIMMMMMMVLLLCVIGRRFWLNRDNTKNKVRPNLAPRQNPVKGSVNGLKKKQRKQEEEDEEGEEEEEEEKEQVEEGTEDQEDEADDDDCDDDGGGDGSDNDDVDMKQKGSENGDNDSDEEKENSLDAGSGTPKSAKREKKGTLSPRVFPSSSTVTNPFKIGTPQKPLPAMKGTQVFDSMTRSKPTKLLSSPEAVKLKTGSRKTLPNQTTLFASAKPSKDSSTTKPSKSKKSSEKIVPVKSGFPAWFKENKDDFEEENPDMSADELKQLATSRYKELPSEEKEIWSQKVNGKSEEVKTAKKRKRANEESVNGGGGNKESGQQNGKKKKILSQETNSKLTNFMFKKD